MSRDCIYFELGASVLHRCARQAETPVIGSAGLGDVFLPDRDPAMLCEQKQNPSQK